MKRIKTFGKHARLVRCAVHGEPADLAVPIRIDACIQRRCDELRAKTYPEQRNSCLDRSTDEPLLVAQPRKGRLIVDAHGAAEHDQKIRIIRCRQIPARKEPCPRDRISRRNEPRLDAAEALERYMLQHVRTTIWRDHSLTLRVETAEEGSSSAVSRKTPWPAEQPIPHRRTMSWSNAKVSRLTISPLLTATTMTASQPAEPLRRLGVLVRILECIPAQAGRTPSRRGEILGMETSMPALPALQSVTGVLPDSV